MLFQQKNLKISSTTKPLHRVPKRVRANKTLELYTILGALLLESQLDKLYISCILGKTEIFQDSNFCCQNMYYLCSEM